MFLLTECTALLNSGGSLNLTSEVHWKYFNPSFSQKFVNVLVKKFHYHYYYHYYYYYSFSSMLNDLHFDNSHQQQIIMKAYSTYYIFYRRNRQWASPDLLKS